MQDDAPDGAPVDPAARPSCLRRNALPRMLVMHAFVPVDTPLPSPSAPTQEVPRAPGSQDASAPSLRVIPPDTTADFPARTRGHPLRALGDGRRAERSGGPPNHVADWPFGRR